MELGRDRVPQPPPVSPRRPATGLRARLRLAGVTLIVAAVPVTLAAWLVASALGGHERDRADARLTAALRVARNDVAVRLREAERDARRLAATPAVQRAILRRDRRAAQAALRHVPMAVLRASHDVLASGPQGDRLVRSVDVVGPRGRIAGRVGVAVPLGAALVAQLQSHAAVALLLSRGNRIVAGPFAVGEWARLPGTSPAAVEIGGRRYRAAGLALPGGHRIVAAIPSPEVEAAAAARARDVALAALATLLTILILAEAFVPIIRRRRRPEDEEEPLELLGAALAVSHDRAALLPIILETAVEATGALGGVLFEGGEEVARAGQVPSSGEPLMLRLARENGDAAEVALYPPAAGFSRAERRRAEWFAAQASIAVENAQKQAVSAFEAVTDPLTGLANRRRFMAQLASEAGRSARSGRPVAVIAADLDDFKQVNDRFGHEAGDDVLRAFARVLRGAVREVDVAARLGGEEFAVLLPETDAEGAEVIAGRLRERLEQLTLAAPDGRPLSVTASFGYASAPPVARVEDLPAAADEALYRAKRGGKNQIAGVAR